jgi:hypothetical protein
MYKALATCPSPQNRLTAPVLRVRAVVTGYGLRSRGQITYTYLSLCNHGIATGYGLDDQGIGVPVPVGEEIFTSYFTSPYPQTGSGAQSASYPMVTTGSFPGIKQPGREAGHSLSRSRKTGSVHPLPVFMT